VIPTNLNKNFRTIIWMEISAEGMKILAMVIQGGTEKHVKIGGQFYGAASFLTFTR
jgi:hypothetical protein